MPVIDVDGVALGYREAGDRGRLTVVLAHSIPFGAEVFDEVASELARDFHLVVVVVHGHGASGVRAPLTLEGMADDFHRLLGALGLSRVAWVGYSIGGMIGMRLALRHPEAVGALVLLATGARPDPPEAREMALGLWERFGKGDREEIAALSPQFYFAPATREARPDLVERYRRKLVDLENAEGVLAAVRAVFDRTDVSGRLGEIEAPTLVVVGRDDVITPPAESEWMAAAIPTARLALVDDASHMIAVERPHEVARLVREFLGSCASA